MNTEIKIKDKTFKLGFGLKVLKSLGKKWNLPGVNEVIQRLAVLDENPENVSFEKLDVINDVVLALVNASTENEVELTETDLDNLSLPELFDVIKQLTPALEDSIKTETPAEEPGKQEAPKGAKK